MIGHNSITGDFGFEYPIVNLNSCKHCVQKIEWKRWSWDFSEGNGDWMMSNELDHRSYGFIEIHWMYGEKLCCVSEEWFR